MAIDLGYGAVAPYETNGAGYTFVDLTNPANNTGIINKFEIYHSITVLGYIIGTFYGSSNTYTNRDYESLGTVAGGSKQTFTGLNCNVSAGDLVGRYWATNISSHSNTTGGSNMYYDAGNYFGAGSHGYTNITYSRYMTVYGTGINAGTNTTQNPSSVTDVGCIGNGNITDTGGSGNDVTRRGFCYKAGTSGDPTTSDSVVYDNGSFGTGAYTKAITGLSPHTGYRVRAYAVNIYGTFYGATVQVTTTVGDATVTTQAASNVLATGMTGNGNITDTGGVGNDVTRRGFCYKVGTSGDPTTADSVAYDDGTFGTGAYTKAITGLTPATSYRVRAYVVNAKGTYYGSTVQITTGAVSDFFLLF